MNQHHYEIIVSSVRQWNDYVDSRNYNPKGYHCGANLCRANLCGVDLRGADLRGADLRGADLQDADLSGANLHYADLSGANLSGANLHNADLSWAYFRDADFSGAHGLKIVSQDRRGYTFYICRQEKSYKIKAGCRWFTHDEAIKHWSNRHGDRLRKEIMLYIGMAQRLAELYGWE